MTPITVIWDMLDALEAESLTSWSNKALVRGLQDSYKQLVHAGLSDRRLQRMYVSACGTASQSRSGEKIAQAVRRLRAEAQRVWQEKRQ